MAHEQVWSSDIKSIVYKWLESEEGQNVIAQAMSASMMHDEPFPTYLRKAASLVERMKVADGRA